ncbi:DNA-binding protein [Thermomonas sp.]|uniref:helix-turn-helix domain-containing transcriptional regulator n=1 Tax=Thermomonas sp. TaxID=1971895 RepID=UPI0035B32066
MAAQQDLRAALAERAQQVPVAQLARDAGLTRAGIYKALAAGAQPRMETLQRIAVALGCRIVLEQARKAA